MIIKPTLFNKYLLNKPLALLPQYLDFVMSIELSEVGEDKSFDIGYEIAGGIALIPVSGMLIQSVGSIFSFGMITGYDSIRANYMHALMNEDVRAIALLVSSPGGEVSGCFDLVDFIYKSRKTKPSMSILCEDAYSSGYAIASATSAVIIPRTGGIGSVGVFCVHEDHSKQLEKEGINVSLITFGDHKADGNEMNPLSDPALKRIQADVNTMGELFVDTVARNRNMKPAKVRDTQAATYMGAKGVGIGFADAVMAPDEAFSGLLKELK